MPDPVVTPPLPTAPNGRVFVQSLTLGELQKPTATATWSTTGHPDGVAQIIDLWVTPLERRRGIGTQMLRATVGQIIAYFKVHKRPTRRLWMTIEQKDQIVSRAFLTKHGFHHTGSLSELYKKQELLLYTKALD